MASNHHDTGYKELYVACFYDHLLKNRTATARQGLPPIFPVVLYNGSQRWSARQDIYDMVQPEPPEFLRAYQPHLRYYLIDEGHFTDEQLSHHHTPLSGVFGIENAGHSWEALQQAVDRVVGIIETGPNKERIDRIITRWIKRHLSRLGAELQLEKLESLTEDRDMLAENLDNLVKKERLEGLQEGRLEGGHIKAEQIARNLISRTEMDDRLIAEVSGLTLDEVSNLRSQVTH
ncbi:Rpn family recombination-promoting nuclease/putative transposase [Marinobacter sp. S6332]|uniref:Rpn family recombination-promoting nuclease/putative transposase n=1 Tax=Marinobacter sp. S6332 TaxID=2926403 RepID=UPI001FF1F7DE|nr:Rpn family recombination-promoting nuclease/putative transposase [Marinobacter sp. S6332]MCK0163734.1 Rpn family recombination-promoting nuclease/putative transposase [Marinobacter sp. S6332]